MGNCNCNIFKIILAIFQKIYSISLRRCGFYMIYNQITVLSQPFSSPDLAPLDLSLFPKLKSGLKDAVLELNSSKALQSISKEKVSWLLKLRRQITSRVMCEILHFRYSSEQSCSYKYVTICLSMTKNRLQNIRRLVMHLVIL